MKCEDLTGEKFSRLTVISRAKNDKYGSTRWNCVCDCGKITTVTGTKLRNGSIKSCGCYQRERTIESNKKENNYTLIGEKVYVELPNSNLPMIVDRDDWEKWAKSFRWRINQDGYAATYRRKKNGKTETICYHVMKFPECPSEMLRDHIDGNKLNNTSENIRFVTAIESGQNRGKQANNKSGHTGVYWNEKSKKWSAQITVNKKKIHLGLFEKIEDAIKEREKAEINFFKEYRRIK